MIFEMPLWEKSACSKSDKRSIINVIKMIAQFAEKARLEGLLAIEKELPNIDSAFIKNGLRLIVDGCDPEDAQRLLLTRMYAGHFSGKELLTRMVITKGILGIQRGSNPAFLLEEMLSCLGEEIEQEYYLSETDKIAHEDSSNAAETAAIANENIDDNKTLKSDEDFKEYRSQILKVLSDNGRIISDLPVSEHEIKDLAAIVQSSDKGISALIAVLKSVHPDPSKYLLPGFKEYAFDLYNQIMSKWFVFEDLAGFDNISIQKILREVDTHILIKALKGSNAAVQEKIFSNMSKRAVALIKEDMKYIGPIRFEDVEESKNMIISIVYKLQTSGDIIIARPGDSFIL